MSTKDKLEKEIPQIGKDEVEKLDAEIRQFTARIDGEKFSQIKDFINEKIGKYGAEDLDEKCKYLTNVYIKNDDIWMLQENIFCFMALIYSILSLSMRILQEITQKNVFTSDKMQFALLLALLIAYVVICNKGKTDENSKFNTFLKELNRKAPSMTIIMSLAFYLTLVVPVDLGNIKIIILIVCILLMLLPIMWAYSSIKIANES